MPRGVLLRGLHLQLLDLRPGCGLRNKKITELRPLETGPLRTVVWEVEVMVLVLELKLKLRISRPRLTLLFSQIETIFFAFSKVRSIGFSIKICFPYLLNCSTSSKR